MFRAVAGTIRFNVEEPRVETSELNKSVMIANRNITNSVDFFQVLFTTPKLMQSHRFLEIAFFFIYAI